MIAVLRKDCYHSSSAQKYAATWSQSSQKTAIMIAASKMVSKIQPRRANWEKRLRQESLARARVCFFPLSFPVGYLVGINQFLFCCYSTLTFQNSSSAYLSLHASCVNCIFIQFHIWESPNRSALVFEILVQVGRCNYYYFSKSTLNDGARYSKRNSLIIVPLFTMTFPSGKDVVAS